MARLVPATCPRCGAAVRVDPAVEFVTCTYCGTSSFVETQKRPPPERVIHAHEPVIRVNAPSSAWPWLAVGLGVFGAIGSCAVAIPAFLAQQLSSGATAAPAVIAAAKAVSTTQAVKAAEPKRAVEPKRTAKAAPVFYDDPSPIRGILEEHIGKPLKLTELVIYDRNLWVTAQDPNNPKHIDRHFWINGEFNKPDPVRVDQAQVKSLVFDVAEIDFSLVPGLTKDALAAAKIEDGKVTHIIVRRPLPFRKDVTFRVYVSSERESESYEYTLKGKRLR